MSTLADAVLPWIRSRADLHYRAANAHGRDMHEAIDHLWRCPLERAAYA